MSTGESEATATGYSGFGTSSVDNIQDPNTPDEKRVRILRLRAANRYGRYITSGKVTTANRFHFTYGRVEARMKVPTGRGMWPAFWMLPAGMRMKTWPARGEIDIFESWGDTSYNFQSCKSRETCPSYKSCPYSGAEATVHYGADYTTWNYLTFGKWGGSQQCQDRVLRTDEADRVGAAGGAAADPGDNYHVYALEWTPDRLRFFVDDILAGEMRIDGTELESRIGDGTGPAPTSEYFDHPYFLILNLAVGGKPFLESGGKAITNRAPAAPSSPAVWGNQIEFAKAEFKIDWVRVYGMKGITRDVFFRTKNDAGFAQKEGISGASDAAPYTLWERMDPHLPLRSTTAPPTIIIGSSPSSSPSPSPSTAISLSPSTAADDSSDSSATGVSQGDSSTTAVATSPAAATSSDATGADASTSGADTTTSGSDASPDNSTAPYVPEDGFVWSGPDLTMPTNLDAVLMARGEVDLGSACERTEDCVAGHNLVCVYESGDSDNPIAIQTPTTSSGSSFATTTSTSFG